MDKKNNIKNTSENLVELKINKKRIPLNQFVDRFIRNTIVGMISSLNLKDIDKIENINIKIRR